MHIYIHRYKHIYTLYIHTFMYVYIYTYIYIHTYTRTHTHDHSLCTYAHTFLYIYIYIYIYLCIHVRNFAPCTVCLPKAIACAQRVKLVCERAGECGDKTRICTEGLFLPVAQPCFEAFGPELQCVVAVCCSELLHCVAVCYSVLQCVAVCCCVLQCVAWSCSVLQSHFEKIGWCSALQCIEHTHTLSLWSFPLSSCLSLAFYLSVCLVFSLPHIL